MSAAHTTDSAALSAHAAHTAPLSHAQAVLTEILSESGRYVLRCVPEALCADMTKAVQMAGRRSVTADLIGLNNPSEILGALDEVLNDVTAGLADTVILENFDFSLMRAAVAGTLDAARHTLQDVLGRVIAADPQVIFVEMLTDPAELAFPESDPFENLTGKPEGIVLTGMTDEELGFSFGRRIAAKCEAKTIVPDLAMLELRTRYSVDGLFKVNGIEAWLGEDGDRFPLAMPAVLRTLEMTHLAVAADLTSLKFVGADIALYDDDPAVKRIALEVLQTAGVLSVQRFDAETLVYSPANRSGFAILACYTIGFVTDPASDWAGAAQELARAMWTEDPTAAEKALGELFDCVLDEESDIDPAAYVQACFYGLDLELERKHDPETIAVRLPGGIRELVFVGPDVNPQDYAQTKNVSRIVMQIA